MFCDCLKRKLINDHNYEFDKGFIMNYLHNFLISGQTSKIKLNQIIDDVLDNSLFKKQDEMLIGWFLSYFGFHNSFRTLLSKSEIISKMSGEFENFTNEKDIDFFCLNENVIKETITNLLENAKEDVAMSFLN